MELFGFCKQDHLALYSTNTLVPPPADSSKDHSRILAMRVKYNYLKGYEFDRIKAASNFDEEPNSQGIDHVLALTVDTIPRQAYMTVGCGHRVDGDGKRRFIFVLDGADDKESLENRPLVVEKLDLMFKQATETVLSGPFVYVSDD